MRSGGPGCLTNSFRMGLHFLLGQTERSTIVEVQSHLPLNVQDNTSRLDDPSQLGTCDLEAGADTHRRY